MGTKSNRLKQVIVRLSNFLKFSFAVETRIEADQNVDEGSRAKFHQEHGMTI